MNHVTLTTDFGMQSMYVAAMKGVLYSVNANAVLTDLTHAIPPQDLLFTNYFLRATVPFFPASSLHFVVVDPGVGSDRRILYVDMGDYRLLVPDNGCWTGLLAERQRPRLVIHIKESRYFRASVSNTFHGRDIFAPVAGHLSLGVDANSLGVIVDDWVELPVPQAVCNEQELIGEVVMIDDFGNLLTNIPAVPFLAWQSEPVEIAVGDKMIRNRVRHYAEAKHGEAVVLVSSMNSVELAINQGNAARTLQASIATKVRIKRLFQQ